MSPQSALIIGASRGLGLALTKHYASITGPSNVFASVRSSPKPGEFPQGVNVIEGVDVSKPDCGDKVVNGLKGRSVEVVVVVAGLLKPEKFGESNWEDEIAMYTICAIAPVKLVEALVMSSSLAPAAKIILLTSEGGSITLRTQGEGGGMFGHHGSKAAGNMVGRLLSFDLQERGIPIAMVHPGFLKTEMTKNAGMEEFYDQMGAVTPEEAAIPFAEFVDKLDMSMTGKLWAPMGARGIGNAEEVMGKSVKDHKGPLELPW
ncbi:putative cytoplasm protein [Naematelia encephala]|uniref:Putative cytoplasm protein n=1 Tax=Naematelia encephala TaxID=71784 RepID=A0A1Y2B5S0_9TREE|nr:putative cytoplasm protein [Naematelia encephala]